MSQSKLINSGSYGCVFYPKIPCDKDKNKNKKKTISKKKQATKLIILDESFGTEFKINKTIQKINNYDKWTAIWDEKCLSPKYNKLKQISEINKCIEPKQNKLKKKLKLTSNKKFLLLQGLYGGKLPIKYMKKNFTRKIFQSKKQFIKKFIELFKMCEYLFLGLSEFYALDYVINFSFFKNF